MNSKNEKVNITKRNRLIVEQTTGYPSKEKGVREEQDRGTN